ncbi:hypothetical protein AN639_01020 [Candidatus Epulonipiscium fishelsonii]|uniref:Uncharacterized protein n=1 Tax=Candidatus Epulonipiscium fishelsonii TaxID=77094 RepID=A0ACC8XCE9_9FIRM|nr:hypothetical protein AN396_06195 [Epulopiscium sp. SCG-B11WGA-EpuloA1]ONI41375.1 hypothetical protein AN639_01020 [Epulopiscium sp. SCG-B05WGA-EpuloA1]
MFDYHMHSKYSIDGYEEIDILCKESIKKGLKEIAITDHYDLYQDQNREDNVDFKSLYKDILEARKKYKDKLKIKYGVEIGQSHFNSTLANNLIATQPFDFIIGSVHNLNDNFDVGLCNYNKISIEDIYSDYVNTLIEMAKTSDFDSMGHITYPVRYAFAQTKKYPDWTPFKDQIECLYKELIKQDKGIEINCSGCSKVLQRTMPDLDLVMFYKECGGKILTVGCDSHSKEYVGAGVNKALQIAKQAGFNEITTYTQRKPKFIKIY